MKPKETRELTRRVDNCLAKNGREYAETKNISDVLIEVCKLPHDEAMNCKYYNAFKGHGLCMYEIILYGSNTSGVDKFLRGGI